jgi:predicted acylesterase/phospholipase RssA
MKYWQLIGRGIVRLILFFDSYSYHFGHLAALLEEGILPHIISGTSAGSAIAALVCTRTEEEIRRDMRPEVLVHKMKCFSKSWRDRVCNVIQHGCLFDQEDWMELLSWYV